jgi:hypothetical protein
LLPDRSAADGMGLDPVDALEADQFHRMSAWAGHAGPDSSYPYVNQYEEPLLVLTRGARPAAWDHATSDRALRQFPDLADDQITPSRFAAGFDGYSALMARTSDVGLRIRMDLAIAIAAGKREVVAAAFAHLEPKLAHEVLLEIHEAMEIARLVRRKARTSDASKAAVRAFGAWAVAASATKLANLERALEARIKARDAASLRPLFDCWRQVRVDEHLSLDDGYAAVTFLRQLQGLGLDRKVMLIKSRIGAPALDRAIAAMGLPVVELRARPARVQHWLQFTEPGVGPAEGAGKQVSSTGFHWQMILVASWLRSAGDLEWS